MKNFYMKLKFSLVALVLICGITSVIAQREVLVPKGVILSDTIYGDTTATGERMDDNTVYVLKRDENYLVARTLNLSVPIQIKAEAGNGFRPTITPKANSEGAYPSLINTEGDVMLESVYFNQLRGEGNPPGWGGFRMKGEGTTAHLKDCHGEWDRASIVQMRAHNVTVILEDCRIAKMGDHKKRNGNGRIIDAREFNMKKVKITNCTFYHVADRIIRNMQGGKIDSLIFDHNTGYNIQGFHGVFHLGKVGYAQITNNLIINPKYMGSHTNISEQTGPEPDNKSHYLITADTVMDDTKFVIHHNNFAYEQKALNLFNRFDSVSKPGVLAPIVAKAMGKDSADAYFEEILFFKKMPGLNIDYMFELFTEPEKFPTEDNFPDEIGIYAIDASYNVSFKSATGDDKGGPLGASEWTPFTSSVEDVKAGNLAVSAYPVPASDYLRIGFNITASTDVEVNIYDLTGKSVKSLNTISTGSTQFVDVNLEDIPSGLYFYSVNSTDGFASGKITITK